MCESPEPLIARPETTALVKTPESTSTDNVVLETRELALGENGPATVTEKSQPKGVFESHYRVALQRRITPQLAGFMKVNCVS